MTDVTIKGGRSRENAVNLLAAADVLGLPREVVRTTMNGFRVPEEVAKKAGFDPEPALVGTPQPSDPPPSEPLPEGDREVVETQRATAQVPPPSEAPEPAESPNATEATEPEDEPEGESEAEETEDEPEAEETKEPAGNASKAVWVEYAKSKGATDADLEGLGRNDIAAKYGTKE